MLACTTQKIEQRVKRDLIALRLKEKNLSSSCSCATLFSGSITFTHFFLKTFIHYRDLRYMTYRFLLCCKDFQDSLHNLLRSRIFPLIHVNPSFELKSIVYEVIVLVCLLSSGISFSCWGIFITERSFLFTSVSRGFTVFLFFRSQYFTPIPACLYADLGAVYKS